MEAPHANCMQAVQNAAQDCIHAIPSTTSGVGRMHVHAPHVDRMQPHASAPRVDSDQAVLRIAPESAASSTLETEPRSPSVHDEASCSFVSKVHNSACSSFFAGKICMFLTEGIYCY